MKTRQRLLLALALHRVLLAELVAPAFLGPFLVALLERVGARGPDLVLVVVVVVVVRLFTTRWLVKCESKWLTAGRGINWCEITHLKPAAEESPAAFFLLLVVVVVVAVVVAVVVFAHLPGRLLAPPLVFVFLLGPGLALAFGLLVLVGIIVGVVVPFLLPLPFALPAAPEPPREDTFLLLRSNIGRG